MYAIHPHAFRLRTVAAALLGAIGFLLLAAHVAVPCFLNERAALASAGAGTCSEGHLFKPTVPPADVFRITPPVQEPRYDLAPPLVLAAVIVAASVPASVRRRLRIPLLSSRSLPFATADPPPLPAFAALRDA